MTSFRLAMLAPAAVLAAALVSPAPGVAQQRTLVLAAAGTPEGFDGDALRPGTQETVVQVYEGLTRYARVERDGRTFLNPNVIEGHLAERWTVSPDGKSYLFTLRQGVKSAHGNELTAADVEWGWKKSFDQKRTGNFIAGVSNVTGVAARSRYEVEFTLSGPSSIFLSALTLYTPSIYDSTEAKKHATAEDPWALKWMETNTAGFGAYHLESIRAGEQAIFVANPNYFRGQPHFTRIVYRAVPSAASRITLLKTGQVQWIDRPTIQQVKDLQQDRRVKVESHPGRAMSSIRMNVAMKPFDDLRVRQAFNHAIDKDALREAVFLGTGDQALSIVPPIVAGYDPSFFKYPYDQAKARALLAEAGASNVAVEVTYSGIWWWEEGLAIQVADQLKRVGVQATALKITPSDMRSRAAPAKQDLALFAFEDGPIVLDPVYALYLMAHSKGVSNRAKYASPKMDALIDEARVTLDLDKRLGLMREAQKLWVDDAPWIMTFYPETFEGMSPSIVGWVPHPDEHERWVDLRTR